MLEITKTEIVNRLKFDNPWWDQKSAEHIAFENSPRRQYFETFLKTVRDFSVRRAVVLMGPRRVGKTVMLYHAIRALVDQGENPNAILYLSLDTPIYTGLSLEKLFGYFKELFKLPTQHKLFIFFDEIQYLKNWEVHLKSLVDSYPHSQYKFVATGSAAAALRLKSNESGAGRFSSYVLPPLTFAEYLEFIGRETELIDTVKTDLRIAHRCRNIDELNVEFIRYLNFGGYPEAVLSETIRRDPGQYIKSDIIDKVLLRDLPSLYGISDIQELNQLFTALAYNTGNEVSLDALSKTSGAAKNTIKKYLEYLEAAFLIRRVERIDQNAKRFKRAVNFKVYLTNPSMKAALFGQITNESDAMGAMAETAIFSQWQHFPGTLPIYFARWAEGEVDFVGLALKDQSPQWAVEVKWSDRHFIAKSELDNCVEFNNRHPNIARPMTITSKTIDHENLVYKSVIFDFVPTSLFAFTLGKRFLERIDWKPRSE